jgi:hypothetical protein
MAAEFHKSGWMRGSPSGFTIVALVIILIGGRYFWLYAERPAHRQEIAAAYGSVGLFYGNPETDSAGKHIIFVETSDRGYGVFLTDTATKRKTIICDENGSGLWGDNFDLHVWPWAPDDSAFIYSKEGDIFVCDSATGKSIAELSIPAYVKSLIWLAPDAFLCVGIDGVLYQFEKKANGTWRRKGSADSREDGLILRSTGGTASASANETDINNAFDQNESTDWFLDKVSASVWLQYQFTGPAWAITQYKLVSSMKDENADPRDWELLGSNDGINWTVLDVRTNQTFDARMESKRYVFSNQTPYQFYRLHITATAGGSSRGVRLAEFQLWSEDTLNTASASAEHTPRETAAAAFDGSIATQWFNDNAGSTGWLQYRFGGDVGWALTHYSLTSADDVPDRDPMDWQLQASNDGATWVNLDTRQGEIFSSRLQTKSYSFANTTPYRIYRLNITANKSGSAYGLQLAEFDLGIHELMARAKNPDIGLVLRSTNGMGVANSSVRGTKADNVFDQNEMASWSSGKPSLPVWLQYRFDGPVWAITQYKLVSSTNNASADPRDWQLLASNDGNDWVVLDTRTNEIFTDRLQAKRYALPNLTPYRFYRLNITADAGQTNSGVCLAKLQLWSEDTPDKATASAENAPSESAAKAFDGTADTKWYNAGAASTGWLQYQFGGGAAWVVTQYALTSGNDVPGRDPKDWQFQASNDGDDWTNLDTRTGETFTDRSQTRSYSFANDTPYRFYRLNITANQGGTGSALQLAECNFGPNIVLTNVNSSVAANPIMNDSSFIWDSFADAFSLTALSSNTIAWGQGNSIYSLNLNYNTPTLLLDSQIMQSANTTLQSFSYSKETKQFLLSCTQDGKDVLYQVSAEDPSSGLQPITLTAPIQNAVWLNDSDHDGWVGQQNNSLMIQENASPVPMGYLSHANIDSFTMAPNGRQVFLLGTVSNEPSAGIWQYDLISTQLQCVVPYSDHPSPYVGRVDHLNKSVQLPSGDILDYDIFMPNDFYKHPHRKYPLVIGDTYFGNIVNGAHGRLWVPAIAACDAYVVIVNRRNWNDGIQQWGDDVMAVYNQLLENRLGIDKHRVFLFGVSAETEYVSEFATKSPGLWRGILFLNPTGLPDFSRSPKKQQRPGILISAGSEEHEEDRFKKYQADALMSGALVEFTIGAGQGHHFVGNAAQLERTKAMVHFIFDE